jgi:hypothetical protein
LNDLRDSLIVHKVFDLVDVEEHLNVLQADLAKGRSYVNVAKWMSLECSVLHGRARKRFVVHGYQ